MFWNKKTISLILVLALALFVETASADYTFGTPTNIPGLYSFSSPSVSTDGLSLYVDSEQSGGYGRYDIFVFTRGTIHEDWSGPVNAGRPINSSLADGNPDISADGLTLFFNSRRTAGGHGGQDIWLTTRATTDEPWSEPVNLGPTINGPYYDGHPSVSTDGLSLFFMSERPDGGQGGRDIWLPPRETPGAPWAEPVNLGPIVNSPSRDSGPDISSDGLKLFFDSERPGGYGRGDIWVTSRATTDDPWGEPVNLGPIVNTSSTSSNDLTAGISADGSILYFCSNRSGDYETWQVSVEPVVDFNGDYRVDIQDLTDLIEHWGQNEPAHDMGPTPLGDGMIDAADLEVLMTHWGQDANFIAHWELDETGGDVAYDSIADSDAVVMGEALWQREGGQIEGALQFDGVSSYLSAPFILDPVQQPFSVFAWIKGGQPGQTIISQQGAFGAWLSVDSVGALATSLTFPLPPVTSDFVVTDDHWHHIGLVSDGAGMSLYVDDVEVARSDTSPIMPATGDLQIGAGKNLEAGAFWAGMIDDVRIYNRVVVP